ncbi:aminotransferase class I/II-fold pyridoxal phosphate-dependent enzyme [candidate division KSB1 bacterium]|nr:aminotransferase class I/II-fold pyridoxal phosphate-dependent enzyme [candidate division KSB1 bacterium]
MKAKELLSKHFATICVHGAGEADKETGALNTPIYQSSTFAMRTAQEGAELFSGERQGYVYTRIGNPTTAALEREVAFLEKGEKALALASGMAAASTAVLTVAGAGDSIVASNCLYGGTHKLFKDLLPRMNIEVIEVDATNLKNVQKAMKPNTKLIYLESPANPSLALNDIAGCAAIAKKHGAKLLVDNTFATPYFQRPLELGADIVLHSATKYISGHGDTIAGILVGDGEFIDRARGEILRDLGGCISPFNSWLLLRGLKTLPVRIEKHAFNAMRVAKYLSFHPKIERVWYPGLPTHPQHELAKTQMSGFGGIVAFEIKGGRKTGERFINNLKLMTIAVSLGDVDTLIQMPSTMTHSTYTLEELAAAGIPEGLVRISVGLEHYGDLLDDLSQALAKV